MLKTHHNYVEREWSRFGHIKKLSEEGDITESNKNFETVKETASHKVANIIFEEWKSKKSLVM